MPTCPPLITQCTQKPSQKYFQGNHFVSLAENHFPFPTEGNVAFSVVGNQHYKCNLKNSGKPQFATSTESISPPQVLISTHTPRQILPRISVKKGTSVRDTRPSAGNCGTQVLFFHIQGAPFLSSSGYISPEYLQKTELLPIYT